MVTVGVLAFYIGGCASTPLHPTEPFDVPRQDRQHELLQFQSWLNSYNRLMRTANHLFARSSSLCGSQVRNATTQVALLPRMVPTRYRTIYYAIVPDSKGYLLVGVDTPFNFGVWLNHPDPAPTPKLSTEPPNDGRASNPDITPTKIHPLDSKPSPSMAQTGGHTSRPRSMCAFEVYLIEDPKPFARTDGDTITLSTGLLDFAQTDEDVAFILAHEQAHWLLGHQTWEKKFWRALLGGSILTKDVTQQEELLADRLGLYLVHLASLDIHSLAEFWERLSQTFPAETGEYGGGYHPKNGVRGEALRQAIIKMTIPDPNTELEILSSLSGIHNNS